MYYASFATVIVLDLYNMKVLKEEELLEFPFAVELLV